MKTLTAAIALALAASPVLAQDSSPDEPPQGWNGIGELGYVSSSGNSKSDNVNAKLGLNFEDEEWKHSFELAWLRQRSEVTVLVDPTDPTSGERDLQETANRWQVGASAARKLDERNSLYTSLRYDDDAFAAYDYQATVSVGWGHQAIRTEDTKLYVEIGPGYKRIKDAVTEESSSDFIARGKLEFETALTGNTSLVDTALVEAGPDNTFVQNDLGVKVAMNERFAIKAGLQVRYNSEVPEGRTSTDRLTTVNLVYDF
jgi:putative salt-induced outer membrane protein